MAAQQQIGHIRFKRRAEGGLILKALHRNGARLFSAAAVIVRDEDFQRLIRAVPGYVP